MAIDLSLFKSIDFTRPDTLIFLAIIFVLVLVVVIACFMVLKNIFKVGTGFILSVLKDIFNKDKTKKDQEKNMDVVERALEGRRDARIKMEIKK